MGDARPGEWGRVSTSCTKKFLQDTHITAVPMFSLAGVKASEILVKRRLGQSSSVNIPDASHMIPLEKPAKVGE